MCVGMRDCVCTNAVVFSTFSWHKKKLSVWNDLLISRTLMELGWFGTVAVTWRLLPVYYIYDKFLRYSKKTLRFSYTQINHLCLNWIWLLVLLTYAVYCNSPVQADVIPRRRTCITFVQLELFGGHCEVVWVRVELYAGVLIRNSIDFTYSLETNSFEQKHFLL